MIVQNSWNEIIGKYWNDLPAEFYFLADFLDSVITSWGFCFAVCCLCLCWMSVSIIWLIWDCVCSLLPHAYACQLAWIAFACILIFVIRGTIVCTWACLFAYVYLIHISVPAFRSVYATRMHFCLHFSVPCRESHARKRLSFSGVQRRPRRAITAQQMQFSYHRENIEQSETVLIKATGPLL